MSLRRSLKRQFVLDDNEDDNEDENVFYNFKVLLPNGTSIKLTLYNPEPEMPVPRFVDLIREEYHKAQKNGLLLSKKAKISWTLAKSVFIESSNEKIEKLVRFAAFTPKLCHIIRLNDGTCTNSTMYENLWDLTPDTDLLKETPDNYSFETALADLIDNSLQAVWPHCEGDQKLIRVDVSAEGISVFDTGIGMDSSEENSIDKWGKMGASFHRSYKTHAIGGKPPYLKPYFGMFGYGGLYASMYLGRRTLVSSKTKKSKKVFSLQFEREALINNRSTSEKNWKVGGDMRDPFEEEMKLSPHGSFTKVEIFESKFDVSKIYQLQCRLKDIYFTYIQCDELSKTGRTERPVEIQVNGEDLAEITGGEVAITNLNSKGHEFSFQIRFNLKSEKREGKPQEANARLKFAYFPIVQGKESIEKILESLEEEGCKVSESFQTFSRVSIRRLGRLLPEARWDSIPFMKKGNRASTLQKCCQRVKCFVDLDAGFSPTPSKTDLASQNPFSMALRNFGSKSMEKEKDNDVTIVIHREGKSLSYTHVDQKYQEWVLEMHNAHDEEATSAEDEAVLVLGPLDNKALGISQDVLRVHKVVTRKGMPWKRGQNIKILKGAYAGIHKNNVYATIDYFIIEGFEEETSGDTRILCRPLNQPENEGCKLAIINGVSSLELRKSLSLPITIIDAGNCLPVDADEWNRQRAKQQEKAPATIDLLDERGCRELGINGALPGRDSVRAGRAFPPQIVAVVRPAYFKSSALSKKLDQKHIAKMNGEKMAMVVRLLDANAKSREKDSKPVCSQSAFPTSCIGISGFYIFSLGPNIQFNEAGTYEFSFSIGDSIKYNKKMVVRPSEAARWKLVNKDPSLCNVRVGSPLPPLCIACYDEYGNKIPFTSVPSLEVELEANPGFLIKINNIKANLVNRTLEIKDMLVETDELDKIRPNYIATLEIRSMDRPFSVSVTCKVIPGPLKQIAVNNPQALENLLPGSTVENFILEIFDEYNNHVAEGTNVVIHVNGYHIEDSMGVNRKADGRGCVDLSGILRVTKGYGKSVLLSVMSDMKEEIFRKESQIEARELRLATELPDCCAAGSNLQNLIFEVTDSYGSVDTSIHHDEKSGCFHTMSIESDSNSVESGIRYAFVHGSCKVSSISLPEKDGVFSFKVYHSQYPELHMNLETQLTSAPTCERDEIGYSTPYSRTTPPHSRLQMPSITNPWATATPNLALEQTPCSQFGILAIRSSALALSSQTGLMDIEQYTENLKDVINKLEEHRVEVEERLKCLETEYEHAAQEMSTLQTSLEPLSAEYPECLSTKESMMKQIEEKHHDTAASIFCSLYRKAPPPKSLLLAKKGVFGLVVLLGSVASTSLSRVLSEYLGEDTMLTLVCKSSQFGPGSAEYLRLQSEADRLGRSITSRFHVQCLDATRPWENGLMENDLQKKLAIDDPKLPDGDPIPGFVGFAVNLIDLAPEELSIMTHKGYGLRETLFYSLFRKLQVYETQNQVEAALPYIDGSGAVSLDGFIAKENGFIFCGHSKPEIHFPITVNEDEEDKLRKLEAAKDKVRLTAKKIEEEKISLSKIGKRLKRKHEKYNNSANRS